MDLGATVCARKPSCAACPLGSGCVAYNEKRVAELPEPKPRKPLPQKETAMLILLRQGEVYLEKRPPTGIWGGMWSLPEASVMEADALTRLGMEGREGKPLPELQHAFTHFRLRIVPRVFEVTALQPGVREPGGLWLTPVDAMGAALPKPVREILERLRS
jgi:A/G-specific adenine glycosylase